MTESVPILQSLHRQKNGSKKLCLLLTIVSMRHLAQLGNLVILTGKTDWNEFTDSEKP